MKLNPDCVRHVLLNIEKLQTFNEVGSLVVLYSSDFLKDPHFTDSDILYSIKQLNDNLLIDAQCFKVLHGGDSYCIKDITPNGHEFLKTVQDDTTWELTKQKAKTIGVSSLKFLAQIATGVTTEIIKNKLGY